MAISRIRPFHGPVVFSYGFRPFFLFGALYAGAAMVFWILLLAGFIETESLFSPLDWHAHEMLFGYLAAVIAGFLLTAVPNWTGRLPLSGAPLVTLVLTWATGRGAIFFSSDLGPLLAALLDCAFLVLLVAAATREIVAGRNWRNLKILLPLSVYLVANVWFHIETSRFGTSDLSRRLALAAAIMLIAIIGGRIIPSFTHNWLMKRSPTHLPVSFSRFDGVALTSSAMALVGWVFAADSVYAGWLLLVASAINFGRLARWRGERTASEPLICGLHLAFLWIPIGFALAGLAALMPDKVSTGTAVHAFGAGAIGTMTLTIMVRATLGHTGRELRAGWQGLIVLSSICLAAVARVAHALIPPADSLLHLAAIAWLTAFFGFVALYGPYLLAPRIK